LTGIDALAHALETFVTKPRNAASLAFSREAWRLLSGHFATVLENPDDLDARGAMQLGACFAGLAIENSMLGAAHALANPLTATYKIPHGQAVGLMLPHVIRFNGEEVDGWYREILDVSEDLEGCPSPDSGPQGLADYVASLVSQAGLKTALSQCQVDRHRLPELAVLAAKQWTGTFNPRAMDELAFQRLYEVAF
jgi:alcohol dehydrogenase